jgi:glycosyltransferase involved in cell wall biosynthesis
VTAPGRPITLVTFGTVRASHVGAEGSTWALARYLHEQGRLDRIVCTGFVADADAIPEDYFSIPYRRAYRVWARFVKAAGKFLGNGERRLLESAFDLMVSRSAEVRDARAVVFRKPNFPRTAAALERRGVPSLAIASIHHPRFNRDRVARVLDEYGIEDTSTYTDEKRVEQVSRFFDSCSRILSMNRVGLTSFAEQGLDADRLINGNCIVGADVERFQPRSEPRPEGPLVVLHVSNMNVIKGVHTLFEAWKAAALTDAELQLGGPMDATAKALFERIAPQGCRRLGPVADTPACYRGADVFVSPSLSDSNPNAALEALASGLPLVISDACGVSELVEEGVNGFVYPYDDAEALASKLLWCSENRDRLPAMGRAARESALSYTRDRFAATVLEQLDVFAP